MQGEEGGKDQQKKWNETCGTLGFFGTEPSELGRKALDLFREHGVRTVVELGCGQGRDTWLFMSNSLKVITLEYSEAGICQTQKLEKEAGLEKQVELKLSDVRKGIPLPTDSDDAVYSHMLFCMELTTEQVQFILDECRRVLKPGGLNIYSVRNDHDPHFGKFVPHGEDMWMNPLGGWCTSSPRRS